MKNVKEPKNYNKRFFLQKQRGCLLRINRDIMKILKVFFKGIKLLDETILG